MSARLRTRWASLALAFVLSACSSNEQPPRPPGLTPEDLAKMPNLPPAPTEPAPAPTKAPEFVDLPSSLATKEPEPAAGLPAPAASRGANPGSKDGEQAPGEKEKRRDLGAELQALLGQPTDCLNLQKVVDDGGKIKVKIGAYVGPSGRVTRATVTAPGQNAQALACIERRVVAVKMQDPIEGAPVLVDTELSFEIARNQVAPTTAPPPAPAPAPSY